MNWVPNVLNQVNSSCHSKLKLKITNPLPHCTCLIPPAFLIFLSLSVSLLSLTSSCFLLLSQAFSSQDKIFEHELSKQQVSKKQNKMASNQIFHRFNLIYHVQSKHASSQGQAKVAIMVAHDVLVKQENHKKDNPLFLFVVQAARPRQWPFKNHANPLMAADPFKWMDLQESSSLGQ